MHTTMDTKGNRMPNDTKLQLKLNDLLIRYEDAKEHFDIYHAVHDNVEKYSTKTAKAAAIVAECLITGVTVPINDLSGSKPKTF